MLQTLEAKSPINMRLDKGQLLVTTLGPLNVASQGLVSLGEVATQPDLDKFFKQKLVALPYIHGAYVAGGMVTYSQIVGITLSKKLFKNGEAVVLKADVSCSLIVVPALNSQGAPDPSPPTFF